LNRLNRRRFLHSAAVLAPFLGAGLSAFAAEPSAEAGSRAGSVPEAMPSPGDSRHETTVFIGTQTAPDAPGGSQGIYSFGWDAETGTLTPRGLAIAVRMPTFLRLAPDHHVLFSCNETETFTIGGKEEKSGAVSSFKIGHGPQGATLTHISSQFADGTGTTNINLDRTGRVLLCADYTGGSASSFQVSAEGHISPVVSHYQFHGHGPNKDRQASPHVHRATVSPGNGFALFNDLGLDVIHIYKLDAATAVMTPHDPSAWKAPAGSGPRSLRFHPNGRWAYCVTEMGNTIIVLDWDEQKGTLTTKQTVSVIPKDFTGRSQAAETAIPRDGKFLYAADRYYNHFYSFTIDPASGELHDMDRTPCQGKTPRYITLDPTERWLLAANQDSSNIEIVAIDPHTRRLAKTGKLIPQTIPQFIQFL
jgi:6-phosphogluconolactonase